MKKMIVGGTAALMAAVAFSAAPAPAQAQDIQLDMYAPCWNYKPLAECARDAAIGAVNLAYGVVITAGNVVDDVCDKTIGTCNL